MDGMISCFVSVDDAQHGVGGRAGMKKDGIVATEDWSLSVGVPKDDADQNLR